MWIVEQWRLCRVASKAYFTIVYDPVVVRDGEGVTFLCRVASRFEGIRQALKDGPFTMIPLSMFYAFLRAYVVLILDLSAARKEAYKSPRGAAGFHACS